MQGGWQPPPGGGGGYGAPPGGGGYGQPPPGGGSPPGYGGAPPPSMGYGGANPYGAPAGMPAMGGAAGGAYGQYEFNDMENAVIDKTAGRAKLWGIISTSIGALEILSSCGAVASPGMAANLPSGIVMIVVGISFMGVGNSLKSVVQTQGSDVMHMMQAMEKMGGAFMVQIVCAIVGFVLTLLIIMLVAFVLVAAAATS